MSASQIPSQINGHNVTYKEHRYECTGCGARLLSLMQFASVECSPKTPPKPPPLSWRTSPPRSSTSASQEWANKNLTPTPLTAHLTSLHALLLHLGAEGDTLTLAEHHLREIGVYTAGSMPKRRGW